MESQAGKEAEGSGSESDNDVAERLEAQNSPACPALPTCEVECQSLGSRAYGCRGSDAFVMKVLDLSKQGLKAPERSPRSLSTRCL